MNQSTTLPLPQLTEVMVTAELFETVKEAHTVSTQQKQHMNIVRIDGTLKIVSHKELTEIEKTPTFSLVYSTDRGFIFTPIAGEVNYG